MQCFACLIRDPSIYTYLRDLMKKFECCIECHNRGLSPENLYGMRLHVCAYKYIEWISVYCLWVGWVIWSEGQQDGVIWTTSRYAHRYRITRCGPRIKFGCESYMLLVCVDAVCPERSHHSRKTECTMCAGQCLCWWPIRFNIYI